MIYMNMIFLTYEIYNIDMIFYYLVFRRRLSPWGGEN